MGLKYDLDCLREIGQGAKLKANYHLFSLKYELRMKIIDLDMREESKSVQEEQDRKEIMS